MCSGGLSEELFVDAELDGLAHLDLVVEYRLLLHADGVHVLILFDLEPMRLAHQLNSTGLAALPGILQVAPLTSTELGLCVQNLKLSNELIVFVLMAVVLDLKFGLHLHVESGVYFVVDAGA